MKRIIVLVFLLFFFLPSLLQADESQSDGDSTEEEYNFDLSEIESSPFELGGYIEHTPVYIGLDKDSSLYKLNFYNQEKRDNAYDFNLNLDLNVSYTKEWVKLYLDSYSKFQSSPYGGTGKINLYEGYLLLTPEPSLNVLFGKKTLRWGKGYAWNPVSFIDRPKDPEDPQLPLEGYYMITGNFTKSFEGDLKTISFSPVIVPVYEDLNKQFGTVDHINIAGKLYFLLYDTDIDFLFLAGGSKPFQYGFDFSKNLSANFEIHGEYSHIKDYTKVVTDSSGNLYKESYNANNYLLGLRYLTESNTTFIFEYYRNDTGFSSYEMEDYYSFIDTSFDEYLLTGNNASLLECKTLQKGPYGKMNPGKDYLYLRATKQDAFDIVYFNPSFTTIYNIDDKSFTLTPELLYNPVTNLELRFRTVLNFGGEYSEFGEKPADYRLEFRMRYYF